MSAEFEKLALVEIVKIKNINKSLAQKLKHYNEMLYHKEKLVMKQGTCLSVTGDVKDKENFNTYSKELINHLSYLRDYEGRSDVFNLGNLIKKNNKKLMILRNAISAVKESS